MDYIVIGGGSLAARCEVRIDADRPADGLQGGDPGLRPKNGDDRRRDPHLRGPCLAILRGWSDGAPKFAAAASRIRSQGPLAHSRMVVQGACCAILHPGLPFAAQHWCMAYNATHLAKDRSSPWSRRFGNPAEYKSYRFRALVFKWVAGLVGISRDPVMQWDTTYLVVPLGANARGAR